MRRRKTIEKNKNPKVKENKNENDNPDTLTCKLSSTRHEYSIRSPWEGSEVSMLEVT